MVSDFLIFDDLIEPKGLNNTSSKSHADVILVLSLLLSSTFSYNTNGAVNESSLSELNLIANLYLKKLEI